MLLRRAQPHAWRARGASSRVAPARGAAPGPLRRRRVCRAGGDEQQDGASGGGGGGSAESAIDALARLTGTDVEPAAPAAPAEAAPEAPPTPPAPLAAAAADAPGAANPAIEGADAAELRVSRAEVEALRSAVFGYDTMWVTSVENYQEAGVVFKGNVRAKDAATAYAKMRARLQEVMGDKWQLFLLEDKEEQPTAVLLPASAREGALSRVTEVWLCVAFGLGSVVSSLQAAGIPLFQFLINPFYTHLSQQARRQGRRPARGGRGAAPSARRAAAGGDARRPPPPPAPAALAQDVLDALPLAGAFWATLLAHEAGHRAAAARRGDVALYLPLIVPAGFGFLGSFGGITRFRGFVPSRAALLDVALAGPAAGAAASAALLLAGLGLTGAGLGDLTIDSPALADSLLVGALGQAVLGDALAQPEVQVSSLFVAGWAGLAVNALNLLPTGELDGGRIALALFGRRAATAVGVLTIIGMAIWSFSNPLLFYWVALVLALQRGPQLPCQEELSVPTDAGARNTAFALLGLPLLVLLPYPIELLMAVQQLPDPTPGQAADQQQAQPAGGGAARQQQPLWSTAEAAQQAGGARQQFQQQQQQQQKAARGVSVQHAQVAPPRGARGQAPVYLAAAGVAAALVLGAYRSLIGGALRSVAGAGLDAVSAGFAAKRLQRQAAARLNELSSLLQNSAAADLSGKNLGDEGGAYVIESLAFNTSCASADFSNNGLGPLGAAQLAEVLPTCALQQLKLHTNAIGDEGAALLAAKLSGNGLLLALDLGANGIGDAGAAALAEGLKLNTTLTRLDLSGNAIDVSGARALAEALAANTTLTSLTLSDNYLGVEGAKVLAEALTANTSLAELGLRGNELGDEGLDALATALQARGAPLKLLDVGNNSLSAASAAPLARLLHSAAGSLVELNAYMNELGDAGLAALAPALKDCKRLSHLDLGGNDAGPEGAAALAGALVSHPSLTLLELGYNPLGPGGAATIAGAFKHDTKLETLKLGWCKVGGGEGARALADLLMFNTTLTQLDLRGNGLGNDGAILLSRGLRSAESRALGELDLGYNEVKDDGACALAQALKANPECAVRELRLNANYITRFGQVALTEAVDMVYEMGGGRVLTVTF
ncbi:EGY2 [Scenedesmus sp. PABB004]|nr:EGY2 [Scenedesmus sp. PABB004]